MFFNFLNFIKPVKSKLATTSNTIFRFLLLEHNQVQKKLIKSSGGNIYKFFNTKIPSISNTRVSNLENNIHKKFQQASTIGERSFFPILPFYNRLTAHSSPLRTIEKISTAQQKNSNNSSNNNSRSWLIALIPISMFFIFKDFKVVHADQRKTNNRNSKKIRLTFKMTTEELNQLNLSIKNIRRTAASINNKPYVPIPPLQTGESVSLTFEEYNLYLQQLHTHRLRGIPHPLENNFRYTGLSHSAPIVQAYHEFYERPYQIQRELSLEFSYKLLRKFMKKIQINSMHLQQANNLWNEIKTELLSCDSEILRSTSANRQTLHEITANKNSVFGHPGFHRNNNIIRTYNYLVNRIADEISQHPFERKKFLSLRQDSRWEFGNNQTVESLVKILIKDYEAISVKLNDPMPPEELSNLLIQEGIAIKKTFDHYNRAYENTLQQDKKPSINKSP